MRRTESERFPIGDARKKDIEDRRRGSARLGSVPEFLVRLYGYYTWINSPLDKRRPEDASAMINTFERVLPKGTESMVAYIEDEFKDEEDPLTFAELGGNGSAIAAELTPGRFGESYGVDLLGKKRSKADKMRNHHILRGDLLLPKTYDQLRGSLKGKKLNLIIERMGRGMEASPDSVKTAAALLQVWYGLLADNGMMFVQIPTKFNVLLLKWADLLKQHYGDTIEFRYTLGTMDMRAGSQTAFYLKKKTGAPEHLPMFDAKTAESIVYPNG